MTKSRRSPDRSRRIKARLTAAAHELLARLPSDAAGRVTVTDDALSVIIAVNASGAKDTTAGTVPGKFLSHLEAAAVYAIGESGCLMGKENALKLSLPLDSTKLKYLLANLVERDVLEHVAGEGYRWHRGGTDSES